MSRVTSGLDASAVCLSGLCLAHCLVLPALVSLLPILGAWTSAEWVHVVILLAAAPLAVFALRRSGPVLIAAGAVGLLLLAGGAFGWPSHDWERPLSVAGGLALAGAHLANWRRRFAASCRAAPARQGC